MSYIDLRKFLKFYLINNNTKDYMKQGITDHSQDPRSKGTKYNAIPCSRETAAQIQHRVTRVRPMVERTMGGTMEMRQGPRGQRVGWRGRQAVCTIERHHRHLQSCSLWRGRERQVLLVESWGGHWHTHWRLEGHTNSSDKFLVFLGAGGMLGIRGVLMCSITLLTFFVHCVYG